MKLTRYTYFPVLIILWLVTLGGCVRQEPQKLRLFSLLDSTQTHINFVNRVQDQPDFNINNYLYFYDGGGVAIGDINHDGLDDIYFTSNLNANHLYLNQGDFRFKDITRKAGVGGGDDGWSTGVSMADVNGDGWLDIYVSRVSYRDKKGSNQLFINNGDSTFTEQAAAYGLDHVGFGTQAAFFDYDRDGDLDVYLLNHSVHSKRTYGMSFRRKVKDPRAGDKLYRNDGDHFTDVTQESGIYSSALGYGLGIAISDINRDGWPDIYIGNDFHEDDYLYINNGDGTFSERLQQMTGHTSQSSMGNDIADFNNDGRPDIFSLDMLPEDEATYQRSGGPDTYEVSQIKNEFGYHPQLARNTLQLNRGFGKDSLPIFSDIGALSGVDATDWSWSGLFCDLNLDGRKDLFITNGIYRRPNNLDYIQFVSHKKIQQALNTGSDQQKMEIIQRMPSVRVANYVYENKGGLKFQNMASDWGLNQPGFSNGAAYGDLDNDGDPDLVVNNVNMPAFIYRNNADSLTHNHYLKVKLNGSGNNTQGIGTKIIIKSNEKTWYREQAPVRGFQSSVSAIMNFGLGKQTNLDSLSVIWPDGSEQSLHNINSDQQIALNQSKAVHPGNDQIATTIPDPLFTDITNQLNIEYEHSEDKFNEFERQPLMPHMLTTEGPPLAAADVNGDGLDDFYIGGAMDQAGALYIQNRNGTFKKKQNRIFRQDRTSEDVDAVFFDADGDGDADLYVVSGGDEFSPGSPWYQDRLYINDGKGSFEKGYDKLPDFYANGACVTSGDFDRDGDMDLFVGSRSVPFNYGKTPRSYLLQNDGSGEFTDVTDQTAPSLKQVGMVTDAVWADVDGDQQKDLIIVGEYMPVTVYHNEKGNLKNYTQEAGLKQTRGWWNTLLAGDFDGDGDVDLVAGNLGMNTLLHTSAKEPIKLFLNDFDGNGTTDPILTIVKKGHRYPVARLDQWVKQMPGIQKKFSSYADFSTRTIDKIFDEKKLKNADVKQVDTFNSSYFENVGNGQFSIHALPVKAQFFPVRSMTSGDFDNDGNKDILLAGNFFAVKPSQGRYDAGYGCLLTGDGNGEFRSLPLDKSGFIVNGDSRYLNKIKRSGNQQLIIVTRNNQPLKIFRIASKP